MFSNIIEFLASNNTVSVAAIVTLGVCLIAYAQAHYILQGKVKSIRTSSIGKVCKLIDDTFLDIEEVSYVRASEIMEKRWKEVSTCIHGETSKSCDFIDKYYSYESDKFRGILHDSLDRTKSSVENHIKINGFHKMCALELDVYCSDVGGELFTYNKRVMRIKGVDTLDLIKDTHELRFTKTESVASYKKIVNGVLRIRQDEEELISAVTKKFKFHNKIFNLFKGYLDD